jgi:Coenzyme PQQ synthesis protein D (PqqD)
MDESKFEVNPAVVYREIEGQVLLMLPEHHDLYTLNDTGKFVWQAIVEQRSLPEVSAALAARYNVPVSVISDDVQRLIDDLTIRQVINKIK